MESLGMKGGGSNNFSISGDMKWVTRLDSCILGVTIHPWTSLLGDKVFFHSWCRRWFLGVQTMALRFQICCSKLVWLPGPRQSIDAEWFALFFVGACPGYWRQQDTMIGHLQLSTVWVWILFQDGIMVLVWHYVRNWNLAEICLVLSSVFSLLMITNLQVNGLSEQVNGLSDNISIR